MWCPKCKYPECFVWDTWDNKDATKLRVGDVGVATCGGCGHEFHVQVLPESPHGMTNSKSVLKQTGSLLSSPQEQKRKETEIEDVRTCFGMEGVHLWVANKFGLLTIEEREKFVKLFPEEKVN